MSNIDVKKSFTTPLLKQLNSNKETRESVEGQQGQLLILSNMNAFKKVVEVSLNVKVSDQVLRRALRVGRKKAEELQKRFTGSKKGKRRLATIKRRLSQDGILKQENLKIGQNLFVVTNFETSLKSIKADMLEVIFKEFNIDENRANRAEISSRIQKGHGEEGYAVSQVQIAKTLGKAAQLSGGTDALVDNFDRFLQKAKISEETRKEYLGQVRELSVQYSNMVTKTGRLKAQYFSIITFQDQGSNADDGKMEKMLVTLFRKFINTTYTASLIDMKGSTTIRQKISSHIVHEFTGKLVKNKNAKVILEPSIVTQGTKSSGKTKSVAKKPQKTTLIKSAIPAMRKPKKTKAKKGVSAQPLQLLGILNQRLPETVRKNMQSPALENRTGRFAESVKVTDIIQTPKGFPSIGYTYQRNPYEVYEMGSGSRFSNDDRDPRKLIDRSVREIAAEFAIGRFYTRRV